MALTGEMRGVYRILVGKPEGKRSLGINMRRWEDNIKVDLRKWNGGGAGIRLICLNIGTSGGHCKCDNKSSGSINCGEYLG